MKVRVDCREDWAETLRSTVADLRTHLPVLLLDWTLSGASARLDEHLRQGGAVLALCEDLEAIDRALEAGASDALRWPEEAVLLRKRISRACKVARNPFYERLMELLTDSVEFTTPSAVLLDVNPAFSDVTGYARQEVIGKTPAALFRTENHDPSYYRQIGEAMQAHRRWHGQLTARRQDGSISFQHATIASVRDAADREIGHLAIKRDTSRDNLARAALEGAAGPLESLIDRAAEAVLVHTLDGRLADVNQSACALLGLCRADLLEKHGADLYLDAPADFLQSWQDLDPERPIQIENLWRDTEGRVFPVELSVGRAKLVGAEFVLVVARDVSSRKEAEAEADRSRAALEALADRLEQEVVERTQELRDTLAQQRAILDHLAEGLVAATPSGHIEVINPRLLELLDVAGHYRGLPIQRLDPELADLAARCLEQDEVITEELQRGSGRVLHVVASPVHALDGDNEQVVGSVMLVRDVSLAKEVDRMKTDFIATVSHELRTPLTSVLGFAKLALGRLPRIGAHVPEDDKRAVRAFDQVRSNLEIIAAEGDRLSALINDVLDISKMESGRVDWAEDAIRPDDLVDHVVEVTAALFTPGGPKLVRSVEPDLPELVGDKHRLIQVLINLVSNAVKFTREGTVTLAVSRSPEGLEFSVSDTGSGIPSSDLDAIFERFRQVKDTRDDRPRGTGLGLPISKAIVEHHGGRIGVESRMGEGSRFWFVLPVRANAQSHPPESHALAPLLAQIERVHPMSGPAEILVVDDDPSLRELMRQLLTEAGHEVRLAHNGTQAIDMVRARPPDLLILDVVMPGLSGFDVAAVIRSDPKTEHLPILVVSILADEARGVQVGVDRYLTKPVDPNELFFAVDALLKPEGGRRVLVSCDDAVQAEAIRAWLEARGDIVVGTCRGEECSRTVGETRADVVVLVGAHEELVDQLRSRPELARARVLALVDP